MTEIIFQALMGMFGAIGFAIFFNVRGRKMVAVAVGAVISCLVYRILLNNDVDVIVSLLGATMTVALLSEILARIIKAPVIIMLVPMLVPLFPGGDLYYTTFYLVMDNAPLFTQSLDLVIKEAGAIAFGIILVTCMVQVILKVYRHFRAMALAQ